MKLLWSALIVMLGISLAPLLASAADSRNVSVINETGCATTPAPRRHPSWQSDLALPCHGPDTVDQGCT